MCGFAGQANPGPSGMQSQQAADTHAKAEGAKAAKGKRVAPEDADEDESQVPDSLMSDLPAYPSASVPLKTACQA